MRFCSFVAYARTTACGPKDFDGTRAGGEVRKAYQVYSYLRVKRSWKMSHPFCFSTLDAAAAAAAARKPTACCGANKDKFQERCSPVRTVVPDELFCC